ncbi:hypothetical protein GNP80_05545 [Aliivibrio fischeri]|uniref:hypothetical protein n=1 Tax=Aliivibrio fischeri TaxID=668 RepID=UPI0012D9879D|nr:hypothetical protein [Aliivibrio fischeri]MUK91899.1 hypothetical protein [Aliivibrio fischeri]
MDNNISKLNMFVATSRHYGLKVCFENSNLNDDEKEKLIEQLFEDFQIDTATKESFISCINSMTNNSQRNEKKFKKFSFLEQATLALSPFVFVPISVLYTSHYTSFLFIILSIFGWGMLIYSKKKNAN